MLTVGGTGNLNGDYWKENAHGWAARVPLQAAWLKARRADIGLQWFGATELHPEHNAHLPLMEELGPDWGVVLFATGGNLLLYPRDALEVIGSDDDHSTKRAIVRIEVRDPRHPDTPFTIAIDHLISGSTAEIEAEKLREAANGNKFLADVRRGIRVGDFNSWKSGAGTVRAVLAEAGWRSLAEKAPKGQTTNADLNTGLGWGHDGRRIDEMFTTDLVAVESAQLWDARPLTDHSAFLTARLNVTDVVAQPPTPPPPPPPETPTVRAAKPLWVLADAKALRDLLGDFHETAKHSRYGPYGWVGRSRLNRRTHDATRIACHLAGVPWAPTQGGLNGGAVGASASTHDGLDVIDLSVSGMTDAQQLELVRRLDQCGAGGMIRGTKADHIEDRMDPHVHVVMYGAQWAHPSARDSLYSARFGIVHGGAGLGGAPSVRWYGPKLENTDREWSASPYNPANGWRP